MPGTRGGASSRSQPKRRAAGASSICGGSMETLPNRYPDIPICVRIQTPYSGACPVSGEPQPGSWVAVAYTPAAVILGFDAVARQLPTYASEATDVEAIAQMLARDCAAALGVAVAVEAHYILRGGIVLTCNSSIARAETAPITT